MLSAPSVLLDDLLSLQMNFELVTIIRVTFAFTSRSSMLQRILRSVKVFHKKIQSLLGLVGPSKMTK